MSVVKLSEKFSDEMLRNIIQKYAMGREVWFERLYQVAQVPIQDPNTGEVQVDPNTRQPLLYNQPYQTLVLGMTGILLGPENYVWWVLSFDANPDIGKLEGFIMDALEQMRVRRDQQANGGPLGRNKPKKPGELRRMQWPPKQG